MMEGAQDEKTISITLCGGPWDIDRGISWPGSRSGNITEYFEAGKWFLLF
jgi:hypothetical protein